MKSTPVSLEARIPTPPPPVVPDIKTPAPVLVKEAISPERQAALNQRGDVEQMPKVEQAESAPAPVLVLTQPLFDAVEDSLWVRGQSYKAEFNAQGFTYIPFLGASAPQNYPVQFTLDSITVGGQPLALNTVQPVLDGQSVVYDRGAVREVYHIALGSVEQTFVLSEKPIGQGDLTVRIAVDTELQSSDQGPAIQFTNERGSVLYSKAILVDAQETRTNLQTRLHNGSVEISLPASLLDAAAYPIVIDPIITTFTVFDTDQNNRWPDVSQDATADGYLIVWENQFSATDGDVFSRRYDFNGAPLDANPVHIDFTTQNWRRPKVANNNLANNYLVVAERGTAPSRVIWGRTRVANGTTMSDQFQIGDSAAQTGDQHSPDVGGDPATTGPTYYLVIWTRVFTATDHDVHGRLVNSNATTQGGVLLIDNSTIHDITPRVSKSNGLAPFATQAWTVVWARRFSDTDYDIYARQLTWSGSFVGPTYSIDASGVDNRNPAVTSLMDEDISGQPRRYVVVYEEAPSGAADIYARAYRGTTLIVGTNLTVLEGVATAAARRRPVTESTTNGRFLVASEQQFSGADWDNYLSQYCLSGNTINRAEQHRNLGYTGQVEGQMNIAGVHPSGGGFPREFVVVWSTTSSGTGFGSIRAVRYDAKNNCCIADITDDGNINVNDLLTVINQWSGFCLTCSGDVDGDLAVNVNDLLAVINAWGPCGGALCPNWSCGQALPVCGVGPPECNCVSTFAGGTACIVHGACGQPCTNGVCPAGYTCAVNTCCTGPVCLPNCGTTVPEMAPQPGEMSSGELPTPRR